jgi:hypothetical protein
MGGMSGVWLADVPAGLTESAHGLAVLRSDVDGGVSNRPVGERHPS